MSMQDSQAYFIGPVWRQLVCCESRHRQNPRSLEPRNLEHIRGGGGGGGGGVTKFIYFHARNQFIKSGTARPCHAAGLGRSIDKTIMSTKQRLLTMSMNHVDY